MAVTGLRCSPPPWRFHRGPDPPHKRTPILNPRGAAAHPCSGDLSQPYKQNPAAEETDGGAQVCGRVCSCYSRVSFRWVTIYLPFRGELRGVVLSRLETPVPRRPIDAAPCRWVVVSVGSRSECNQSGEPPPSGLSQIVVEEREVRPTRTVPRTRPWKEGRAVAKAGMHCPVFWTPWAAAAWPERRRMKKEGGGMLREARTVQAVGSGTVPLSLSHRATDAVDQHYPHRHGVVAQSMTTMPHAADCGTAAGGDSPGSGSSDRCWPIAFASLDRHCQDLGLHITCRLAVLFHHRPHSATTPTPGLSAW